MVYISDPHVGQFSVVSIFIAYRIRIGTSILPEVRIEFVGLITPEQIPREYSLVQSEVNHIP